MAGSPSTSWMAPYSERVTVPTGPIVRQPVPTAVENWTGPRTAAGPRHRVDGDLIAELVGRGDGREVVARGCAAQDDDVVRQRPRQRVEHELRVDPEALHERDADSVLARRARECVGDRRAGTPRRTSAPSPLPMPAVMSMSSDANIASASDPSWKPFSDDSSADEVQPMTLAAGNAARTASTIDRVEALEGREQDARLRLRSPERGPTLRRSPPRSHPRRVDVVAVAHGHREHGHLLPGTLLRAVHASAMDVGPPGRVRIVASVTPASGRTHPPAWPMRASAPR